MEWLTDNPYITKLGLEGAQILNLNRKWMQYVQTGTTKQSNDDWANLQNVEDVMRFLQKELNIFGPVDDMILGYELVVIARPIKEVK